MAHEGEALRRLQERFLHEFWDKNVSANGIYDVPTKVAVIKAQHHALYPQTGRLDERTWEYIQRRRP